MLRTFTLIVVMSGPLLLCAEGSEDLDAVPPATLEFLLEHSLGIHADACGTSHLAVNHRQDLITRIVPHGMDVSGPARSPFWTSNIRVAGIRRSCGAMLPWIPIQADASERSLVWDGNGMELQYEHDQAGMRQNFLVHERPSGQGPLELVLTISGDLAPAVREDGIHLQDTHGSTRYRYEDLHVWDACGNILDARFVAGESSTGEVVILVDDTDASYPVMIDPVATTADLELLGQFVGLYDLGDYFGLAVSTAGDVNGDGYSDVIVGAPRYTLGETWEGAAFLYLGGPTGLSATPDVIIESDLELAQLGTSVGHAGDVNGDGFSDVLIGAIGWSNNPTQINEGGVFVHLGSPTGISATPNIILQPNSPDRRLGWKVTGAGDLNGDGFSDVLASTDVASYGQNLEGAVFVYLGGTGANGVTNAFAHRLEADQANAQFGSSIAAAGDIDGDGFDDVLVSSHLFDLNCVGNCNNGGVFVYRGGGPDPARPLFQGVGTVTKPTASQVFNSDGYSQSTGFSVAGAGDVNGDGYSDIIVGDWRDNIGGPAFEGVAFVFHGSASGIVTVPATTIQNNVGDSWLGRCVSSAGDVNGDGYADIIVGASQFRPGVNQLEGAAQLHLGGPAGISPGYFIRYRGTFVGEQYGNAVAVAGDINGDGFSDLIIGAYRVSRVEVVLGGSYLINPAAPANITAPNPTTTFSGLPNAAAGTSVAHAGDVNGDGFSDVLVGAPGASNGQANEGLAHLYYGSATGLAATPDVTLEVNVANGAFGSSVATAGDVNGDGYADVLIGAPLAGGTGRAYIFLGGPGGVSTVPALVLTGTAGSRFGHAVSTAGDINSDGFADILIGAPNTNTVFVHLGSLAGTEAMPHATLVGPVAGSDFGHAVATAGDVNGDGYSDIIIGAPLYANGQANEGAAYAYHGSELGLVTPHAWQREMNQTGANFGFSVAGMGDMNGDGYFDCMVGGPNWTSGQANEGAIWFFSGSPGGLPAAGGPRLESNRAGTRMGYALAEGGDVNGDGYADALVGGPFYANGQADEGYMRVFMGRAGLPPSTNNAFNQFWEPDVAGQQVGWSVAGGGDIDGDGFSDMIAGAPGASSGVPGEGAHVLIRGNWSPSISRPTRLYMTDLVNPLATNGLDPTDVFFGIGHFARSHMQRKPGRLRWEVVFEGQPYSGSPITSSMAFTAESATWTDLGLTGVEIKELVYKEPFYIRYKWRVRVEYPIHRSIDGQRFSKWHYGYASAHGDIGVLPVELLEFQGGSTEQGHSLWWSTASESGTDRFEVERSPDLESFRTVGSVPAAGDSWDLQEYAWSDREPPFGLSYYRLHIVDRDGTSAYSNTVALDHEAKVMVMPNPVANELVWLLEDDRAHTARILDATGRLVAEVPAGAGRLVGGPLIGLPHGIYTLVLTNQSGMALATTRFVKD